MLYFLRRLASQPGLENGTFFSPGPDAFPLITTNSLLSDLINASQVLFSEPSEASNSWYFFYLELLLDLPQQ